jgi:IS30 family transposase
MFGIMAALTAKLKLPNVQTPQPRRTIPDPKPCESQYTTTEIARIVGRHPSTIRHEIKRGCGAKGYRAEQACHKAAQRASHSRNAKAIAPSLWQRIEPYIHCDWSPEQIAGHFTISHETVYLRIYADKAQGQKAGGWTRPTWASERILESSIY